MSAQLQFDGWPDHIAATAWRFERVTTTPSRRALLLKGDKLIFQYTSADRSTAEVVVLQGPDGLVDAHGGPIKLGVTDPAAATLEYRSESYGRVMSFYVSEGKLIYRAMYECEPHCHPDEGGEGDPW